MTWFNYYGLIAIVVIMIPNIVGAILDKDLFVNKYQNKTVAVLEQIGRYGSMLFMVFNVPYTYFGFWFDHALAGWIVFGRGRDTVKMLWLSITPTILFLFSGIMILSIPLMVSATIFGIGHITISYKNRD